MSAHSFVAFIFCVAAPAMSQTLGLAATGSAQEKPRVVVTTDPELDDANSLIRYLLYSTDFRTEGLIYASSGFHWKGSAPERNRPSRSAGTPRGGASSARAPRGRGLRAASRISVRHGA